MVTYTPILKLAKPLFDQTPWDEEINGDLNILDSAVGNFFGIANYVGLWRNSTAYVAGQVVTDAADSSLWTCVVSHTSSVLPTTFAQDRTTYPTYWVNEVANASDLAQQAADSAAAAAASAAAAAASAATINSAVPLAGGTMTGLLVLSGDPAVNLGAATKQYVDARVGGTAFLPITGGTVTGNLSVAGQFSVTGMSLLGAITRNYQAGQVPIFFGYHDAGGGAGFHVDSAGNLIFSTYAANGGISTQRGYFTPSGAFHAASQIDASQFWSGGSILWGAGVGNLWVDGATTNVQFTVDGWKLQFNRTNGTLAYVNNAGGVLYYCRGDGVFVMQSASANAISVAGTTTTTYLNASQSVYVGTTLTVSGHVYLNNTTDASTLNAGALTATNAIVYDQITIGNYINCSGGAHISGDVQIDTKLTANNDIYSNSLTAFSNGYKPGGGMWAAYSDARMKTVDGSYDVGLQELLQLEPVRYHYKTDSVREFVGLVAQQAEKIMPEMVTRVRGEVDGKEVDDLRTMDTTALMYAVINALKEVSARLDALETTR